MSMAEGERFFVYLYCIRYWNAFAGTLIETVIHVCRSRIRSAGIQHGCNRSWTKVRSVLPKKLRKKAVFTRSEFIGTCACLEIKKLHKAMEIWLMFIITRWLLMLSLRLDRTLWIATARESRMARGWSGANWNGKTLIGLKESTSTYRIALRGQGVGCVGPCGVLKKMCVFFGKKIHALVDFPSVWLMAGETKWRWKSQLLWVPKMHESRRPHRPISIKFLFVCIVWFPWPSKPLLKITRKLRLTQGWGKPGTKNMWRNQWTVYLRNLMELPWSWWFKTQETCDACPFLGGFKCSEWGDVEVVEVWRGNI